MREFAYLAAVAAMAAFVSGNNWPTTCADGEMKYIPNEYDCTQYHLCYMGQEFNRSCTPDTAGQQLCFDAHHNECGRWNNCDCIKCKSLEDSHKWPDTLDEHMYYQCRNGKVEKVRCDNGEKFDPSTLTCRSNNNKTCSSPGSLHPHHCLCQKYYECIDGEQIVQDCPAGQLFDADLLTCRSEEDARCNGTKSHCPVDGIYPSDSSCYFYYKCANGVKTTHKCKYGMIFDKVKLVCVRWDMGICSGSDFTTPNPNSCIGWHRKPDKLDCNRYYECDNGIVEKGKCLENHYFNEMTELCDLKKNVVCKVDDCPTTDCGRLRYPHAKCEFYYECQDGKKVPLKCPEGLFYNKNSEMCDLPANVQCSQPRPVQCPPGSLRPHDCQCNMYYVCGNNEQKKVRYCPAGTKFDERTLKCVQPEAAQCHKEHKKASFDQTFSHWLR